MKDKKLSQENKDFRIERAVGISKLLKERGYKILQEEWERIKEEAFKALINESLAKDELRAAQMIYNQICEWIDLPSNIIKEGNEVSHEEERTTFRSIKENIAFLGRRY